MFPIKVRGEKGFLNLGQHFSYSESLFVHTKKSPALEQICFIVKETKTQKNIFVFTLHFLFDVMYYIYFYLTNTLHRTGLHHYWSHCTDDSLCTNVMLKPPFHDFYLIVCFKRNYLNQWSQHLEVGDLLSRAKQNLATHKKL